MEHLELCRITLRAGPSSGMGDRLGKTRGSLAQPMVIASAPGAVGQERTWPACRDPAVTVLAAVLILLSGAAPAQASPFERFTGSFSATGSIVEGPNADAHPVRCNFVAARQGASRLGLRGTCSAYLVIARSVSADLVLDPGSGRVTGTYTGARVGTARLTGRQQGRVISLSILWPAPVFGTMTSAMTIASLDPNRLRIVVLSRIGTDGPVRATTDLLLQRQ